jgi:hypothetical protein
MANSKQPKSIASWRKTDFRSIKETYINEPTSSGTVRGTTILYVIMSLLLGPVALLYIPILIATGKGKTGLGFFKFIHYLFIVPCLLAGVLAFIIPPEPYSPHETATTTVSAFVTALYFFVMMTAGTASIRGHYADLASKSNQTQSLNPPIWLVRDKVFGTPGDLSTARRKFKAENVDKGEDGERRTAEMMKDLLRIPGTRIFHGVQWPGSKTADIDHIAVNGNKIALIDSKLWSGKSHAFTKGGHVTTRTEQNKTYHRNIKFHIALMDLKESLRYRGVRYIDVRGWIAIHNSAGTKTVIDKTKNRTNVLTLACTEEAIDEIGNWFAKEVDGTIRVKLMDDISRRLK